MPESHVALEGSTRNLSRLGLVVCERNGLNMVTLRGDADNPSIAAAVITAFGVGLPCTPNTAVQSPVATLLWLAPDSWMAVVTDWPLVEKFAAMLASTDSYVLDTSHMRTVIRIEGDDARSVLARHCRLDLHQRTFALDACAQTSFMRSPVLLHRNAKDSFDIYVSRSYACSVRKELEEVATRQKETAASRNSKM